jgi:tetratricopeptide (TPR) repeat protein
MKFNRIKRFLLLVAWLFLPILSFGNDQAQALFTKGNALYTKGQYKEALDVYQQVLNDGYQSAALYFNMGNASYKNDDLASAILYYEKAHKLAPGDEDINVNIRFVNLKTTDKIDEVPGFFLANWWKAFILSLSTGTLAALSIIFALIGSAMLVLYFFANSISVKKASFYISISLLCLGVFAVFIAGMQIGYFNSHRQAIVFSSSATIKSAPADRSASLFVIHDGAKVNILDESNGWMKIRLANGNVGWIKDADVKEI